MHFQRYPLTDCCLCGSQEDVTGEHKIKASALRKEFGKGPLQIGVSNSPERKLKPAQSSNSKHLKFKASICAACNSSRTQKADQEFDHFHQLVISNVESDIATRSVFDTNRYAEDSVPYLNVFRYFAKLLCCQIAAVNGPILSMLAEFAIEENSSNRVWLEIKADPVYEHAHGRINEFSYAAHSGLTLHMDPKTGDADGFESSITIGPVQYRFYCGLEPIEQTEIRERYPDFLEWCSSKIGGGKGESPSDNVLSQLGLKDKGEECDV